jgi:hypothetical protein
MKNIFLLANQDCSCTVVISYYLKLYETEADH